MRSKSSFSMVTVVLLLGAAAAQTQTAIEVVWDGQTRWVMVDSAYTTAHPEQRGIQATVANLRNAVSNHENRITSLENMIPPSGAMTTMVSHSETGNTGTVSPGNSKGGDGMSPGTTAVIAIGGLLLIAALTLIVVGIFQNANGGGNRQRALATAQAMQAQVPTWSGEVAISATDNQGGVVAVRYNNGWQPSSAPAAAQPTPSPTPTPALVPTP